MLLIYKNNIYNGSKDNLGLCSFPLSLINTPPPTFNPRVLYKQGVRRGPGFSVTSFVHIQRVNWKPWTSVLVFLTRCSLRWASARLPRRALPPPQISTRRRKGRRQKHAGRPASATVVAGNRNPPPRYNSSPCWFVVSFLAFDR